MRDKTNCGITSERHMFSPCDPLLRSTRHRLPQAEEEAWARLPAVVPSNPESEGGPSDADDVQRPGDSTAKSQPSTRSVRSDRQRTGSPERAGLHTDLEIEIPACDDDDGDGLSSEAQAARVAARRGLGTGSAECREEGDFLPGLGVDVMILLLLSVLLCYFIAQQRNV